MTKKDYIIIADAIKQVRRRSAYIPRSRGEYIPTLEIINAIAQTFALDNQNFDKDKFISYINQ